MVNDGCVFCNLIRVFINWAAKEHVPVLKGRVRNRLGPSKTYLVIQTSALIKETTGVQFLRKVAVQSGSRGPMGAGDVC